MTKRFLPFLLSAVSAILLLASCTKKTDEFTYDEPTRGFYPLGLGHYVIYDVDSTIWNDFDCSVQTRKLQIRYTIADTFTDLQGRPSYRVDVDERRFDTSAWRVNQVFYVTPTGGSLESVMQNLRMTKLVFPIREGATWFGNRGIDTTDQALRQYGNWVYKYFNYIRPYNNGRATFNETVTVDAIDETINDPSVPGTAYAERNFFREVYGYNVGLVYREHTFWTYDDNGSGSNACRKGFGVVMRAISWRVR